MKRTDYGTVSQHLIDIVINHFIVNIMSNSVCANAAWFAALDDQFCKELLSNNNLMLAEDFIAAIVKILVMKMNKDFSICTAVRTELISDKRDFIPTKTLRELGVGSENPWACCIFPASVLKQKTGDITRSRPSFRGHKGWYLCPEEYTVCIM